MLQVASLAALVHAPLMSAYAASKAGAEALARGLRPELAPRDVTVGLHMSEWGDHLNVRDTDNIAIALVLVEPDDEVRQVVWGAGLS